jgi:hypothetical protein
MERKQKPYYIEFFFSFVLAVTVKSTTVLWLVMSFNLESTHTLNSEAEAG